MESYGKKQGIFPSTLRTYVSMLLQIKETIRGKNTTISIAPSEHNNYISDEFSNEWAISRKNISERLDFWNNKEYAISNLQWNIGDYTGVSQFIVKSLWSSNGDLVLVLPWLKTFPYKNKK